MYSMLIFLSAFNIETDLLLELEPLLIRWIRILTFHCTVYDGVGNNNLFIVSHLTAEVGENEKVCTSTYCQLKLFIH